jgi:MFS superfamily sulfate permease-like transporter
MTRSKPFIWIASALFALAALAHLYRLVTHFQIIIGSHAIPMWCSYVAIVVAAFLSWMLCREARGTTGP